MDVIQASLEIGETTNPKLTGVALEHVGMVMCVDGNEIHALETASESQLQISS